MEIPQDSVETWSTEFDRSWLVFDGGGVFGGLLLATMHRAAMRATGLEPISIAAQLPAAVSPGERVDVHTSITRAGRHSQDVEVAIIQSGQTRVTATATVAATADSPVDTPLRPPDHGPEDGEPVTLPVELAAFSQHYEYRAIGPSRPLGGGPEPFLAAWIRPRVPATAPAASVVAMLDALAPALFAVRRSPVPIPTLEFSAHLTPGPTPTGWLFLTQRTLWSTGRFCVDEAIAIDETGKQVGTARQVRQIRRPRQQS
ncbi:MAG TPA: thioesterase family protein [Mycobacteriales bacterium]|nr:thioesterase family protein [Mycobacteriales bacterium]